MKNLDLMMIPDSGLRFWGPPCIYNQNLLITAPTERYERAWRNGTMKDSWQSCHSKQCGICRGKEIEILVSAKC